jgi:hypothetical protein
MDNKSKVKQKTRNYWKTEEENILKQWADKAQCYQWMHSKCRNIYKTKNAWFTIPVIIISTVTGTANFAQDRFPEKYKEYMVMTIGTLSIIAGIITTIYQFLKISELNEGHRAATISWGKFYNTLKTTVARHPLDRAEPSELIKIYKDEYERMIEISPDILPKVLINFNKIFQKNIELVKPEICSKLDTTQIFDMTDEDRQKMINSINNIKTNKKFVDTFFRLNGRNPSETEIPSVKDATNLNMDINDSISSTISTISSESIETNNSNISISSV